MNYYVLSDEKFLAFEWGRAFNSYLMTYAKKHNISLSVPDISNPPKEGYLFLLGVDALWLKNIAENISSTDLIVILLAGEGTAFTGRTIHIIHDQPSVIRQSINLLCECGCTKTALFGVQKNDTSDLKKSEIFSGYHPTENIYYTDNDLTDTFLRLKKDIGRYDSIICTNDLFGVFLLKKLKVEGIPVPQSLKVVGNGNLWLSSRITPSLTSACGYDFCKMMEIVFGILKNKTLTDSLTAMNLCLKNHMILRETTGNIPEETGEFYYTTERSGFNSEFVHCDELKDIVKLNRVLPCLSNTDRQILIYAAKGFSYEDIAKRCFLAYDSVKYHIKKIYASLGIHNRTELCVLLENNLINADYLT